jgi:hypothetical protein
MPRWPEKNDIERFESRHIPEPNSGCFLWLSAPTSTGYGSIELRGRTLSAHRFAYALFRGEIPDGLLVCHHCDNPLCVNPDHMFIGTDLDNQIDCIKKGRAYLLGPPKGADNACAKLTKEQVLAIRNDNRSQHVIAKDYSVSQGTISRVKLRKRYRNV